MSTTPRPLKSSPVSSTVRRPAAPDFLCRAFGSEEEMRTGAPSGGMHGEASLQG
jgi:hypothetical protein